jgi:hypothetical protein
VDLLPDRLQVVGGVLEGIELSVEEVECLRPVGLGRQQVDQVESKLLAELPDVDVALIDQLAAGSGALQGVTAGVSGADLGGQLLQLTCERCASHLRSSPPHIGSRTHPS